MHVSYHDSYCLMHISLSHVSLKVSIYILISHNNHEILSDTESLSIEHTFPLSDVSKINSILFRNVSVHETHDSMQHILSEWLKGQRLNWFHYIHVSQTLPPCSSLTQWYNFFFFKLQPCIFTWIPVSDVAWLRIHFPPHIVTALQWHVYTIVRDVIAWLPLHGFGGGSCAAHSKTQLLAHLRA